MAAPMTVEWAELPGRIHEVMAMIDAGHEVVVTDKGAAKAVVEPVGSVDQPVRTRKLGLGEGRGPYHMAEDFNAPLPDEFWLGGNP